MQMRLLIFLLVLGITLSVDSCFPRLHEYEPAIEIEDEIDDVEEFVYDLTKLQFNNNQLNPSHFYKGYPY